MSPKATFVHCFIHRFALCAKVMPPELLSCVKVNLHSIRFSYVFVRFFTFLLLLEKVCAFSSAFL